MVYTSRLNNKKILITGKTSRFCKFLFEDLKNYISEQNDNFYIVGGDFNIYSTTESAYQSLFDITESGKGNLHDIINVTGTYNDPLYAKIHTQSKNGL